MKKVEFLLKNFLLNLLLILKPHTRSASETAFNQNDKILFIRLNRIGDALVSTPLLHFIKQKLNCKIYVLADVKNFFVFRNNPDIEETIIFKKGIKGFREFFHYIKTEKINTVADLHDDVSTTVSFLVGLSSTKNKFGLEKANKKLYTATVPRLNSVNVHVVTRLLQLSRLFDLNPTEADVSIKYSAEPGSMAKAKEFVSQHFKDKKPILGINISAGSDARFWGVDRYRKLIDSLSEYDLDVLLLAAPKDSGKLSLIGYSEYFVSHSFDEFAAVVSQLKLLFTPDTAAVHIASAYNIPVFGIYVHDTEDLIWSPVKVDFDYVETSENNLKNLEFETVFNKFQPFLEQHIK
jgi:ADP-heptose:LPS heptosyltransferase